MVSIREEQMNEEFMKYHLEGLPVSAVLHKFDPKGKDAQIHDHPFGFTSFIVKGGYIERRYYISPKGGLYKTRLIRHEVGEAFNVQATDVHEIVEYLDGECWTLIVPGPWEQVSSEYRFENNKAYKRPWNESEFREV